MPKGSTGGRGGIGDSGVFGLVGTTVQCNSEDKSWYCKFAKLINVIVWILMILAILYFVAQFLKNKKK